MTFFFNVFIVKTVGKGHGSTLRPLFLIGVWHIKQKRRALLRWVYNLLGGSNQQNDICKSGIVLRWYSLEQCLDPMCRTLIKTRNFVTFYKFLTHLGIRHTLCILSWLFFSQWKALDGLYWNLPAPASSIPQIEGPPLPSHMTVPLPDGMSAPIPTLPPTTASLMLGIWFVSASQGTKHIAKMCQKGIDWADWLYTRPLPHSEAWTSFILQLFPGMSWGISTIVLSLHKLYLATKLVYYRCLPFLCIQRHIELPWQTLPKAFQGIGLRGIDVSPDGI